MVDAGMYAISKYKPLVPSLLRERISKDLRAKYENRDFDFRTALVLPKLDIP